MNTTPRSGYKKPTLAEQYNLDLKNDNADRADDIDTYPHTALRYGAVGDGVADDTVALQATIDAAKDYYTPGVAYFPDGKYLISAPLIIDRRVNILGCGRGTQIFQENDEHLFSISPYISAACHDMTMRNLTLGSAATTPGKALIRLDSVSGLLADGITMAGGSYGLSMTNSHTGRFTNLTAYPNIQGFFATCAAPARWVSADETDCNAHVFISPNLNMGGYGFYIDGGAEVLTILGGTLQGGSSTGMYLVGINRLTVLNTHFESTATQLYLESCINGSLLQIGLGGGAVTLKNCIGITIEESKFSGSAFSVLPGCKRCVINGLRYGSTTLKIAPGTTDVRGLENSADANVVYAGESYSSPRNLIDGDMEMWTASNMPDGFSNFDALQVNSQESTIVKNGSSSAKVVIGAGRNRAGLRIALDYDKYSRMHAVTYRSADWSWVASGSGTNEYRLETSGGADPDLPCKPKGVLVNSAWASEGTMGALADGEWDYGDNDSLGYDTFYVRNDAGDPDAEAVGWLQAVFTLARLTITGWVYKESGSANPYLGMEYTGGIGTGRKYLTFSKVPLNQWTRVSITVDILPEYTAMKALFNNCWYNEGTPGDTCYWDMLEVTEGDASSPVYDDSRGIDGDFRIGGRFLLAPIQAFTDSDATPSVDGGASFKTANTGPTTITDFNDGYVGQQITVYIEDGNTTIDFSASGLIGNGGVDWSPASGDHMVCSYDGADWRCIISDADMVKRDGSTTLTGDWDAGSHEIRAETFESDVATGTPPLIVASETMVANLNADLLDGIEASAFATDAAVLKKNGSVALTSTWDIGAGQRIDAEEIRARSNVGLKLSEDGGAGIFIEDGGEVGIGNTAPDADFHVGNATNKIVLDSDGGVGIAYHGTARPTRYIELPIEIFEPEGDGGSNTGTVTGNFDTTNFREYWRWTSGSASQDMDFWVEFMIPDDFAAWAAANSFNIDIRTNDKDNNVATVTMYLNDNSADAGINGVSILPSANDTWETKQDQPTGTYSAGQRAKLKIHVGNNAASDTVDIARVFLSYLASN